MKFAGRSGVVYTVAGKGGLVREVLLPHRLAERFEALRLDAPERVVDRRVRYLRYDERRRTCFRHIVLAGQHRGAWQEPRCPRTAPQLRP